MFLYYRFQKKTRTKTACFKSKYNQAKPAKVRQEKLKSFKSENLEQSPILLKVSSEPTLLQASDKIPG